MNTNSNMEQIQSKYKSNQYIYHIYRHSVNKGDKCIIIDDVLATGGTLNAAIHLLEEQGA